MSGIGIGPDWGPDGFAYFGTNNGVVSSHHLSATAIAPKSDSDGGVKDQMVTRLSSLLDLKMSQGLHRQQLYVLTKSLESVGIGFTMLASERMNVMGNKDAIAMNANEAVRIWKNIGAESWWCLPFDPTDGVRMSGGAAGTRMLVHVSQGLST